MSDIPNDAKAERLSILPYDFVKQNNIFGIDNNGEIKIYSTSELSFDIHQELLRYIGKSFEVEICNGEELNNLITSNFSVISQNSELSEELKDNFDLKTFAGTISATEDLLSGSNDAPIIKLINGILSQAIKLRASDIHFEPYEDSLSVRYRIDGILQEVISQDPRLTPLIIARLKVISKLDISERRLPQDGRVSLSLGDKNVDVRVSTLPSTY